MNKDGIFTTLQEREQYGLDKEYEFIKEEGTYNLVLEYRAWGNNKLECYFFDNSNPDISIKAYLFVKYDTKGNSYYKPINSNIDFRYAEEDRIYQCTFKKNSKGFIIFDNAVLL